MKHDRLHFSFNNSFIQILIFETFKYKLEDHILKYLNF